MVLAFSGGLDTSFCVPWLKDQGWEVHTAFVDTGGTSAPGLDAVRCQAMAVGAARHHLIDARQTVYRRFIRYLIQGNMLRGEVYPLSVAAERTQQATSVIELARQLDSDAVAHGSTGAGNDQVRFDVAFRVLAPDLDILTPIRDEGLTREQAIAYLTERS
ncbi:MAG: argininosuccinate synthase domain-containing protein, partial [Gemmatimonadales bacterium]